MTAIAVTDTSPPSRHRRRLIDIALGGAEVGAALLGAPLVRRRYNTWGASAAEVTARMPGDELVVNPKLGYTRAITINAPPQEVWPWLAQIGQGRGGLYSFDGLENLVRCEIHSVDRVMVEHQRLHTGDLIRLGPEGYPCFQVIEVDPPHALVLVGADPKPPHQVPMDTASGRATWQWLLRSLDGGTRTRLVVRQRLTYPSPQGAIWHVVEPIAFVMERQMLLGIKRRAEAARFRRVDGTDTTPAATVPLPVPCPFDVSVDVVERMLNFEIADDPTYSGIEIQAFDDDVHGCGLLVLLTRRADERVDCYLQPGLRLDPGEYGIGSGLGRWTEATISPALFEITPNGVQLHVGLQDTEGRMIDMQIDDRTAQRRRPATMLAPVGAAIQHPNSLMLVWMREFDLVRRSAQKPQIRIDGRSATTGRLPGGWLHRRRLIKYANDLAVVRLNTRRHAVLACEHLSAGVVELDPSGTRIASVTAAERGHRARLHLEPPLADIEQIRLGTTLSGSWRVSIDAADHVVGGRWTVKRQAATVTVALDVTRGWRPANLPLLMRLVTTVAPVFRRWPTTYRWRASIRMESNAVMSARWSRCGGNRGESYRYLTRTRGRPHESGAAGAP